MNKFGVRLKHLREERKLLSKDFAKIMNVEPATITNWEKGNRFPKDSMLIKIADYFDCSTDYLLGRTENPSAIVYSEKYNKDNIKIEIDKNYPQKLTTNDVKNIIDELVSAGFDVEALIKQSKSKW